MSASPTAIRSHRRQALANEWSLVLASAGIASQVVRRPEGFFVVVEAADAERAESELRAHDAELEAQRAERARRPPKRPTVVGPGPIASAVAVGLALTAFHGVTGPVRDDVGWFDAGTADAIAIRAGELWRAITALCLHADPGHLAANLLFGSILLVTLGRGFGAGVAGALVLLAGFGGNLANAFLRSGAHLSIGASTAVFGAVGLLAGDAIVNRAVRGEPWRRVVAPFAAALGLLAMMGSGEDRVDIYAHLFGIAVGAPLGVAAGVLFAAPPTASRQWLAGIVAVVGVAGSWWLAFAAG